MDMRDHAREALQFVTGKNREDLDENRMLNLSLVRLLEIIGEASSRVTESTKKSHPEIPWQQISGLRNRLIHGYNQVDLDILWNILQDDIPVLLANIEKVFRSS